MPSNELFQLFVFGAGASHASGNTPLGKDLVWDWYADCSTFPLIGPNGKPVAEAVEEDNKEFKDFGEFLRFAQERYPALSNVYDQWQKAVREGEHLILNIAKPYCIDEIMEGLAWDQQAVQHIKLIRKIAAAHIIGTSDIHTNNFYQKFTKSLKNKSREEIAIISFNFDCLLRDDLDDEIYFDHIIEFEQIDRGRCFYQPGRGIPLLKLHGSLDWCYEPSAETLTLLPAEWHKTYGGEPFVFLPHEIKHKKIGKLWDAAASLISKADKITFVGYSLPDYDKDVQTLFGNNIRSGPEIVIVDSSPAVIERYKTLFPSTKVQGIECDLKNKTEEKVWF